MEREGEGEDGIWVRLGSRIALGAQGCRFGEGSWWMQAVGNRGWSWELVQGATYGKQSPGMLQVETWLSYQVCLFSLNTHIESAPVGPVCGLEPTPLKPTSPDLAACRYVASGPMVRSSYKAGEFFLEAMIHSDRGQTEAPGH
jgi:hypothetical protein